MLTDEQNSYFEPGLPNTSDPRREKRYTTWQNRQNRVVHMCAHG